MEQVLLLIPIINLINTTILIRMLLVQVSFFVDMFWFNSLDLKTIHTSIQVFVFFLYIAFCCDILLFAYHWLIDCLDLGQISH